MTSRTVTLRRLFKKEGGKTVKGKRRRSSAFPPKILWLFFCLRGTLVSHNSPWNTDFFLSFFPLVWRQDEPRCVNSSLHALWDDKPVCNALASTNTKSFPTVNLSSLSEGWVAMAWGKCGLNGFNERRESLVLFFLCLNNGSADAVLYMLDR